MKTSFLFFTLIVSFSLFSQTKRDTIFIDSQWKKTSSYDSSGYFGFRDIDENGEGVATYYYSTGELYSRQFEKKGKVEGYCTWYYKSGTKLSEGNYVNGKPSGEQVYYTENGLIESTEIYNESDEPNTYSYDLTKPLVKDSLIIISQPEVIQLYRGYPNIIEVGFRTDCEFQFYLNCRGCDSVYNIENNVFALIPRNTRVAFVEVYKVVDNDKYELISRLEYHVRSLPDPTIYIGGTEQEGTIYWKQTTMFAKYPPEIMLDYQYRIENWQVEIGRRVFSGAGNVLSDDVLMRIKRLRKNKRIDLKVTVIGENNEENTIETFYTRVPNEWYKEFEKQNK